MPRASLSRSLRCDRFVMFPPNLRHVALNCPGVVTRFCPYSGSYGEFGIAEGLNLGMADACLRSKNLQAH